MECITATPKNPIFPISLSQHAKIRQQQRCIKNNDICLVLLWGRVYTQGNGRAAFFLGQKEVKQAYQEGLELQDLEGIAVIESSDGEIVTVIRCKSPSQIKKKRTTYCHSSRNKTAGRL